MNQIPHFVISTAEKLKVPVPVLQKIADKTGSDFQLVNSNHLRTLKSSLYLDTVYNLNYDIQNLKKIALEFPELEKTIQLQIECLLNSQRIDLSKLRPAVGSTKHFFEYVPELLESITSTKPFSKKWKDCLAFEFSVPFDDDVSASSQLDELNSELSVLSYSTLMSTPIINIWFYFSLQEAEEKCRLLNSQGKFTQISRIEGATNNVILNSDGFFENGIPASATVKKISNDEWQVKCSDTYKVESITLKARLKTDN